MSILFIDDEPKTQALIPIQLGAHFELELHYKQAASEARDFIDLLGDLAVVVCRDQIKKELSAKIIYEKLNSEERLNEIIYVVIGKNSEIIESPNILVFDSSVKSSLMIQEIEKRMTMNKKEIEIKEDPIKEKVSYTPFPIDIFTHFSITPTNIFLKIKKLDSISFINRFKEGDILEKSIIEGYQKKGAKFLYVRSSDKKKLLDEITAIFLIILNDPHSSEKTKSDIQNLVIQELGKIGLNEASVKLAKDSVNTIINEIEKKVSVAKLLRNVFSSGYGLKYRNAYTICLLGIAILKKMDWANTQHHTILTYAALFHDMSLDNDEYIMISEQAELHSLLLDEKINSHVERHAETAALGIRKQDKIPSEVEKVVKQHHGVLSGIGYSTQLSDQITPLTKVFMVCEEFSFRLILSGQRKINILSMIKEIDQKYENKTISQTLEILKSCFK